MNQKASTEARSSLRQRLSQSTARLLGFALLVGIVAILLYLSSEYAEQRQTTSSKDQDAPTPEVELVPVQQPIPIPTPAEVPPTDPNATTAKSSTPPQESTPPADTSTEPRRDESMPALPNPFTAAVPTDPPPAEPPALRPEPVPTASEMAKEPIEEHLITDELFIRLEQAQGRVDRRSDAQRRRQENNGWYGWGVINDLADPDRAARLLGGTPVVREGEEVHALRERNGRVEVRPISNVGAAYGTVGLPVHDTGFKRLLRRAIDAGDLVGPESRYELWYIFAKREALHLADKVVRVFECQVAEQGLKGDAADVFRQQARLRVAVVALRRPNGGRLGVALPRYFSSGSERLALALACQAIDDESRQAWAAVGGPPPVHSATAG